MASEAQEKGGPHDRARIVRRYLSALDARKPGRTAARTAESVQHRMHQIDTLLLSADPVARLHLTQERIDLHAELLRLQGQNHGEFEALEKAFIRVARPYGDRHDVTYSAWRQVGVDAGVLAQAGIHQQAKPNRQQPQAEPAKASDPAPVAEDATPVADDATPAVGEPKPAPKKAPAKKATTTKKATAAKKAAADNEGSAGAQVKKAAPAKKKATAAEPQSEQQQLPAEAHLLS